MIPVTNVIIHVQSDQPFDLPALLEHLRELGVTSVTFPGREYPTESYETARLLPRGSDGGFAEQFLRERLGGS